MLWLWVVADLEPQSIVMSSFANNRHVGTRHSARTVRAPARCSLERWAEPSASDDSDGVGESDAGALPDMDQLDSDGTHGLVPSRVEGSSVKGPVVSHRLVVPDKSLESSDHSLTCRWFAVASRSHVSCRSGRRARSGTAAKARAFFLTAEGGELF